MSKEMREHIDNFRNFLTENSKKKLNISDVIDSDFFYNELKRCIDDSYERDLDEKDFTLSEYKLIEEIKHVIKNHFL